LSDKEDAMPKTAFTLSWSAASGTYAWSGEQGFEILSLVPDSPAWFAWLAELPSFAFHGQVGSYTARQERRGLDERYWYAYRRTGQKLRKKYLGKTTELALARLEQVAGLLEAERFPAGLPAPSRSSQLEPHEPKASPPGEPFHPLLSTKLHVPRLPVRLVPRARLIERLTQGLSQTLILLCAPAGFGKTTLLAQFLAACGLPAAWLSLDAEDNDPQRFLSSLLAALQSRDPSLGASVQALLSSPHGLQGLSLSAVFTQLINDLVSRDTGEVLLVLEDYHTITAEPIQHALASLVEHCPPQLHLLISARADPRLPLARLRAQGQLCELRAADLQFDAAEASRFLRTTVQRDLEESTLATIHSRTEGWVAGLQLSALLLQERRSEAEVRQVLSDALGSHRYLVAYLGEEVFSRQSEAVQSFLLHTSILERLSAPLCAAVSGERLEESAATLALLERANLFLVPLDERGEWYRAHPLWAGVLRVLLRRTLGATGVAALYGRASRWYEQHDLPAEAIAAAMEAGEFERAAQLIDQICQVMMERSQSDPLRRWVERLPHELWAARPMVCLTYAWTLLVSGAYEASAAPLSEAEKLFRRQQRSAGVGLVEALRAVGALLWADGREALRAAQEALELLPARERISRGTCLNVVGGGSWLLGEVERAWRRLQEAWAWHEQTGHLESQWLNSMLLGHVLVLKGQLNEAAERYQHVIDSAAERREYSTHSRILLASLLYEWNALQEAEAQLAQAIAEAAVVVASPLLARGVLSLAFVWQARIKQARGEDEAASTLLRQAMTVAQQKRHPQYLAQAQAAQVRFWLAHGQGEAVTRWREAWTRPDEATPRFEDEPAALTLARVLLAQGEPEHALRLLEDFRALARTQGRLGSELEMLVLCALAESASGQTGQATQHLEQALALAEPEGYVRLFVDEGVPMLSLLRLVLARWKGKHGAGYVRRLLTILEAEHPQQAEPLAGLQVPLSKRERLILRELAAGHSTTEMATDLVVSPNTIKAQVSSLYRKLNVHNRQEALAEAVRLHML
jgi:LuxR family transcriptional regulator, maltose regulon positive regulatory protein